MASHLFAVHDPLQQSAAAVAGVQAAPIPPQHVAFVTAHEERLPQGMTAPALVHSASEPQPHEVAFKQARPGLQLAVQSLHMPT
jgi:hypothetical protein